MNEEYNEPFIIDTEEETTNEDISPIEERKVHEIDSKYRLILLAAQRSKQIQRGANIRVSMDVRKHKPTRVAIEEIRQGKVHFEFTEE